MVLRHYADRLHKAILARGNALCVGIDPRLDALPPVLVEDRIGQLEFQEGQRPSSVDKGSPRSHLDPPPGNCVIESGTAVGLVERYCERILEIAASRVPVVKFQMAFFECWGVPGLVALQRLTARARKLGLIIVLDGKRNDIGSTAVAYAQAYLRPEPELGHSEHFHVDALTINPYLGSDGIRPFVEAAEAHGKGIYCLVRTSNPSASELQDLRVEGRPVYQHLADRIGVLAQEYRGETGYSLLGAVAGATYPDELVALRRALPLVPFLVPGYGSQGGTANDVARAWDADGQGALVNSSRAIIQAYQHEPYRSRFGDRWEDAVKAAIEATITDLNAVRPSR